jgi:nitroreductase
MTNPVQQAILDRRSTRGFDEAALSKDQIGSLIDAALASPSAMNRQPWHFAFVTDRALLKEFSEAARTFFLKAAPESMRARFQDPAYEFLMNAPLFVVVSYKPEEAHAFTGVDCGIAVQNLALSAMGLGLGSVIVGMPKDVLESETGAPYKARMGVPAGNAYAIGILIGHNTVTKDAHEVGEGKYTIV